MIAELKKIVAVFEKALVQDKKKYVSPTCLRVIKSYVAEEVFNLYRLNKGIKAVEVAVRKKEALSALIDKLMRYNSFVAESVWNFNRFSGELVDSQEVYDFDAIDMLKYAKEIQEGEQCDFITLFDQLIQLYEFVNKKAESEVMPKCEIARAKRYFVHLEGVYKKLHDFLKTVDLSTKLTKQELKSFLKTVRALLDEVVDCGFGITHITVLLHNRCTLYQAEQQLAVVLKDIYATQGKI